MKHLTGLTALLLCAVLYCTSSVIAAPNIDEIDLNELRKPPAKSAKKRHITTRKPKSPSPKTDEPDHQGKTGSYVIKPGDHLFLILMKHYGLSNDAAERMIPEVVRLNGLSNPKRLTVGQRLTIPVLTSQNDKPVVISKKPPPAEPPPLPESTAAPQQSVQTEQSQMPTKPNERQVTISVAPPCVLARTVIEHLGLLAARIKPLPDTGFTAATVDRKLVVACDLSPEETYTYNRLLSLHNVRLLTFKGDESPKQVIEALAKQLGFSFQITNPEASDTLPTTYVFPAKGTYDQDVRLTIGTTANQKP